MRGHGVLIVDHDVELLSKVCDRLVCLDRGVVVAVGRPAEVRAGPESTRQFPGACGSERAVLSIGELQDRRGRDRGALGGNGAGKTALLETVLGFRSGALSLFGRDAQSLSVEQRVASGRGLRARGPARLRRPDGARESRSRLVLAGSRTAAPGRGDAGDVSHAGRTARARAWLLSGGQQQMLALARAEMNGREAPAAR